MNLSRRSFLGGAIALTAAVAITGPLKLLPRIIGDGVHNDAPGLNALFRGEPVSIENKGVKLLSNSKCEISGGIFNLEETIVVANGFEVYFHDCTLVDGRVYQTGSVNLAYPA